MACVRFAFHIHSPFFEIFIKILNKRCPKAPNKSVIEIIFLQLNCDYTYRSPNFIDMKEKVYSKVGVLCNTKGIHIMRENLGTAAADFL